MPCAYARLLLKGLLALTAAVLPFGAAAQSLSDSRTSASKPEASQEIAVAENYGKLPLSFEANRGQTDPQVKFLSRGNGYSLFLTNTAAVLALSKNKAPAVAVKAGVPTKNGCPIHAGGCIAGMNGTATRPDPKKTKTDIVRMELAGASHGLEVTGTDQLPGTANYFIGNDPSKWHSAVPTYAKVKYTSVYPGIDLVYYGNQRQLEYDFVVAPHANPKPIRLHFTGARQLKLSRNGDLQVIAKDGKIAFHKPVIYQEINGQRQPVEGRFNLLARSEIGFTLGRYDKSHGLVIDPEFVYSTYLGGSGQDDASAIAVDAAGDAYVTGAAGSTDFPLANPFQSSNKANGAQTAFVTKMKADGSALVYSTYLGGSYGEGGLAIAVDSSGSAYVSGYTGSSDFPVVNALQGTRNTTQTNRNTAFVTKFTPSGSALAWSTYLGGSTQETAYGIAVDSGNNVYVTGATGSTDFPTVNALQPTNISSKLTAFVSKIKADGSGLIYSTYLGGSGQPGGENPLADTGFAIAVDSVGNAYVTGVTLSQDFPTVNPLQSSLAGFENAFVSKINADGSALIYSTFLGGMGPRRADME